MNPSPTMLMQSTWPGLTITTIRVADDEYVTEVVTPEGILASHRNDSETAARRAHLRTLCEGIPNMGT